MTLSGPGGEEEQSILVDDEEKNGNNNHHRVIIFLLDDEKKKTSRRIATFLLCVCVKRLCARVCVLGWTDMTVPSLCGLFLCVRVLLRAPPLFSVSV